MPWKLGHSYEPLEQAAGVSSHICISTMDVLIIRDFCLFIKVLRSSRKHCSSIHWCPGQRRPVFTQSNCEDAICYWTFLLIGTSYLLQSKEIHLSTQPLASPTMHHSAKKQHLHQSQGDITIAWNSPTSSHPMALKLAQIVQEDSNTQC